MISRALVSVSVSVCVSVTLALVAIAFPSLARAHPLRFGALEVIERAPGEVTARLRFSGSERAPGSAEIVLPASCTDVVPALEAATPWGIERERRAACAAEALAAGPIGVRGIGEAVEGAPGPLADPAQVALRIRHADGRVVEAMLDAHTPAWRGDAGQRAAAESTSAVLLRYGALGVEHILLGFDHLLFLVVLLLAIRERRRLAIAITAFTAGHSLTLALAALDVVRLAAPAVEAAIAISIAVIAADVVRRGADEPSRRDAALLPATFGLVHGLGFAGVLRDIGLPDAQLVPALVSFNVGVELGQLAFVAGALGIFALLRRRVVPELASRASVAVAYAAGIAAAALCLHRVLQIGALS